MTFTKRTFPQSHRQQKGNPTLRSTHSWLLENVHSHDLIRKYYYAHQVCTYSMFIHNDNIRSEIELPSS